MYITPSLDIGLNSLQKQFIAIANFVLFSSKFWIIKIQLYIIKNIIII